MKEARGETATCFRGYFCSPSAEGFFSSASASCIDRATGDARKRRERVACGEPRGSSDTRGGTTRGGREKKRGRTRSRNVVVFVVDRVVKSARRAHLDVTLLEPLTERERALQVLVVVVPVPVASRPAHHVDLGRVLRRSLQHCLAAGRERCPRQLGTLRFSCRSRVRDLRRDAFRHRFELRRGSRRRRGRSRSLSCALLLE